MAINHLGASQVAQGVKNLLAMQETPELWVRFLGWEDPPRGGHGNPLQYSYLKNPMDRGAWRQQSIGGKESDMTDATENSPAQTIQS